MEKLIKLKFMLGGSNLNFDVVFGINWATNGKISHYIEVV